jgi:hypothetical protein
MAAMLTGSVHPVQQQFCADCSGSVGDVAAGPSAVIASDRDA